MNTKYIFTFFLTIHFFACDIIEEPYINQINQVNELKLKPKFDPIYFWDLLYN